MMTDASTAAGGSIDVEPTVSGVNLTITSRAVEQEVDLTTHEARTLVAALLEAVRAVEGDA